MKKNNILYRVKINSLELMQTKAEIKLNPWRYYLSEEAKKRLRWMYLLYYEHNNNVTLTANKIGISREWLSKIKSKFEKNNKNPRSLEPESRTPKNRTNRKRISQEAEDKIMELRNDLGWGKDKIQPRMERYYKIKISSSTINRYLHKHLKINPQISQRNKKAWVEKKARDKLKEKQINLEVKYRPPTKLKDYAPGALIEKDMKLVPTVGKKPLKSTKFHIKDHFNYQHTFIDTFTRIRAMELTKEPDSQSSKEAYLKIKERLPFNIACVNTDNGGENEKDFKKQTRKDDIIRFYSRSGTPTDNPRVERSHLTDEVEFYNRGNSYRSFEYQKQALNKWEYIYNYIRPHQALGNLTPMEFYRLWKKNPQKAYKIKDEYQKYLTKQRKRLANARKIKKKEQIEKLMKFIDVKLGQKNKQKIDLKPYKLELTKCELCSWT